MFVTPWTVAHQDLLSMGFPRQEYWGGLPCPPPRDLPNPGIEPGFLASQADSLPLRHQGRPLFPRPGSKPEITESCLVKCMDLHSYVLKWALGV